MAEGAGEQAVAALLADPVGLAGEQRLVDGQPARGEDLAVGDELIAGLDPDTSPGTTSSAQQLDAAPSRITSARGATSSASWSSVSFAFISWRIPIAELMIAISAEERVGEQPLAEDEDEEDEDDRVEEREDVRRDDRARPSGSCPPRAGRAARGGAAASPS